MQDNQSQTQWIYAAAIMDSDGCFMITRANRKDGTHYYTPMVKIAMINNGSINYIHRETKLGKISITGVRPSRPNSLPLYEWRLCNKNDLIKFLNGIMPYLQNKKDRAQHLLNFCAFGNYKENSQKHMKLTKDELHYRDQAYLKMRELNANKVGATTKSPGPERACDSLNS